MLDIYFLGWKKLNVANIAPILELGWFRVVGPTLIDICIKM